MRHHNGEEANARIVHVAVRAFTLLLGALLVAGCMSRVDGTNVYSVKASVGDAEDLFTAKGTLLTVKVTAHAQAPAISLGVGIPDGVEVLEGNPEFKGTMTAGEQRIVEVRVRASQPGAYTFSAYASDLTNCLDGTVVIVNVKVSGNQGGASIERSAALPAPTSVEAHLDSQAGAIRVTATSSQDFPAQVCITTWFTNQQQLAVDEPREWSGQLHSGTQDVLKTKVHSPADGRYQLQATVRPHPSTGYGPVADFLWVIAAGQSFVETT